MQRTLFPVSASEEAPLERLQRGGSRCLSLQRYPEMTLFCSPKMIPPILGKTSCQRARRLFLTEGKEMTT